MYESRENKDKNLSVRPYLYMIVPYSSNMMNDHQATKLKNNKSWEWKIQLNVHINFISSKDTGETRTVYVWSENAEIIIGNETDDIMKELFESFLDNYQKEEQIIRGGCSFIFESVELLDYHLYKMSIKRGKSYIKSPKWLENKRATINPQNNDDKCFPYAVTVALNHQNIENNIKN